MHFRQFSYYFICNKIGSAWQSGLFVTFKIDMKVYNIFVGLSKT